MIRTKRYKLNCYDGGPGEFFDLESDPDEFHNLINTAAHKPIIDELLNMFNRDHPDFEHKNKLILEENRLRRKKIKPKIMLQETP